MVTRTINEIATNPNKTFNPSMAQKQQLDIEKMETDKALEELKKVADGDAVYKHAGSRF